MAYSSNPNLARARALALKLLVVQRLPVQTVANRCGVHRTTIWRWKQKWDAQNKDVQLENENRPNRTPGTQFRLTAVRLALKRCAEVVWYHLTRDDGIHISLSSVRRILRRQGIVHGRKPRVRRDNPRRPLVLQPGELVQTDTVHYVCAVTKRRRYAYTVIDLYTRMAYVELYDRIGPGIAAKVILRAQAKFGFMFSMVQSDNGPEFSRYFEDRLHRNGIPTRHSRLHRPNDNAHIERFNRTIQEECTGRALTYRTTNQEIQDRLTAYLDFYNTRRVHLGLQLRTPADMLQRS